MMKRVSKVLNYVVASAIAISLIVAGGEMVGVIVPKEVKAAEKNLLINPGAEDGDLTGWVDPSEEKCWKVGWKKTEGRWSYPEARSGKYYFMAGWPSTTQTYMYQDVSISSYIGGVLKYEAYLGGFGHSDKGGIKVELLDKTGAVISSKASEMFSTNWGDWSQYLSVSLDVPEHAYIARVYLIGELHEGKEADAYFDDLALTITYENNLLVNPGAENGDLTGWVDPSEEKCWKVGWKKTEGGWSYPEARSGKYYFMAGWSSTTQTYMYQDVSISSYIGGTLKYEGYLGGFGHTDQAGIKLELLDVTGAVISSKASKMYSIEWGDWSKHVSVTLAVPKNACTARVYLIGVLDQGKETDAYFDDLALTFTYEDSVDTNKTTKIGAVKNVKLTNKKGNYMYISYNSASGATGYQIRYSTSKSMKNAKTMNTTLTKGYFTNSKGKKVSFKKGTTYYVQVRGYAKDSNGKKVYGAWSSAKKIKITK